LKKIPKDGNISHVHRLAKLISWKQSEDPKQCLSKSQCHSVQK
jgi:hypothetical protein